MVWENHQFCRRTRSVGTLLPVSLNVYSRRSNLCRTRPNAPYRIREFGVVLAKVRVVSPNHQGSVSHSPLRAGGTARIIRHAMPASENGSHAVREKTVSAPRASVATAHGKWSGKKNRLCCNMQIITRDSPRFQVRAGNRIRPLARGRRGRTMIGQRVPLLQCLVFSGWRKVAR